MKKLMLILMTGIILSGCSQDRLFSNSSEKYGEHIYPFRSAIIKYSYEGRGMEGTRVVYIDNCGALETEHIKQDLRNDDLDERMIIKRGKDIYTVYLINKVAQKSIDSERKAEGIDCKKLTKEHGDLDKALNWLDKQGIHYLGTEEVKGYKCQVIRYEKGPLIRQCWIYNGIALKIHEYLDKYLTHVHDETFTDIQFDVNIDPNKFIVPDGIEIIDSVKK